MSRLSTEEAAFAWHQLYLELDAIGAEVDLPKFKHLLAAIRRSTLVAVAVRRSNPPKSRPLP